MCHNSTDSTESGESKSGHRVDLTTTLYGELRKLAAAKMVEQPYPHTLQATALVHEAWLRLGGEDQPDWNDRKHLYAALAKAMRHILVDRAKRRNRIRHGGGLNRVNMDAWNWEKLDSVEFGEKDKMILVLNDLIEDLTDIDPQIGKIVQLHYFAGLSISELSSTVDISERTVRRRLSFARAWLGREIRRSVTT